MQLSQKDDAEKAVDHWAYYAAGIALAIASVLGCLSNEFAFVVGFSLVAGLGALVILSAGIRRLDAVVLIGAQLVFGAQILMAIYYDARLTWIVGGMLVAVIPSVLWISALKWNSQSIGAWSGYFFVAFGFLLSILVSGRFAKISFVVTVDDILLVVAVIASLLTSMFLWNGIFKKHYILAGLSGFSSMLVFVTVLSDVVGSGFGISGHRLGLYTLLGPNLLAFCLDISMPLSLGLALSRERGLVRNLLLLNASFLLAALLLTGTRGSIITIVATSIWMIAYHRKHKYFWIIVIPVGFVVFAVLIDKMIGRLVVKSESEILSTLGRLLLLKTSINILELNDYIWGVGMNRFSAIKFEFGFPLWFNPTKNMSSHNTYLEYWLGWGAISLFGYLMIVARACLNFFRQASPMNVGAAISILGYSMHGFVDSSVASYPITFAFWLLLGTGISAQKNCKLYQK